MERKCENENKALRTKCKILRNRSDGHNPSQQLQAGIPYDKMEEMGIMSPVLGVECKYIHSVHFNENVKIEVRFRSFTGVKMEIEYKVYSMATGELTTTGLSRHGFVHSDTGRPVRMKKEYPDLYAKIMDALE